MFRAAAQCYTVDESGKVRPDHNTRPDSDRKETSMMTDVLVMAELFVLRFGLPLLVVAGGGYLFSRYLDQRREAAGRRELDRKAEEKLKEIERRRHRVA